MKINYLTRPKTPTEIEAVIKSLLKRKREKTKKKSQMDGFGAEFYHTFIEEIIPIILKQLHK
jgi:DNA-binding response OmpR family regulator